MIASVNGINIHYEVYGVGIPIIMIEGLGYSTWMWEYQKKLSSKIKVILYDNRGVGQSDKPIEPYTMDNFTDDLKYLTEFHGFDKFFLLGVSMGGMIAQAFTLRFPDKVLGLVLTSTNFGVKSIMPDKEILDILSSIPKDASLEERMKPAFSKYTLDNNIGLFNEILNLRKTKNQNVMQLQQLSAVSSFDSRAELNRVNNPTLIIAGLDDIIVPPKNSEILHQLIRNSRLIMFRNSGHLLNIERHSYYNKEIIKFIKLVDTGVFKRVEETEVI